MVFDEVLTGFRVAPGRATGGWSGVGAAYTPDLVTFGKVVGGGMPLAALAGPAVADGPARPPRPGLPGGHPVREPAGHRRRHRDPHARGRRRVRPRRSRRPPPPGRPSTRRWTPRASRTSSRRAGSLFSVFFGEDAAAHGVRNYADAQAQDVFRFPPFFHAMLDAGVTLPPSVFEAWFLSSAHDDAALDRIIDALPAAARAAAAAKRPTV